MTMLEASLRKLVREEAASSALETVGAIQDEVRNQLGSIRADLNGIARDALSHQSARLATWARMNIPRPEAQAERPFIPRDEADLARLRTEALQLAIAARSGELLADAERFARFIIDGCLDGNARPICAPPDEQIGDAA